MNYLRWDEGTAHPRVGGENIGKYVDQVRAAGSSPRGRGKHLSYTPNQPTVGLIPAWAGKTHRCNRGQGRPPAHPRVGGENIETFGGASSLSGSSPRGRGKPRPRATLRRQPGLIPAWAGKTPGSRSTGLSAWAHPRVGGENLEDSFDCARRLGSSPRGRGKRRVFRRSLVFLGLIPAWAGKTETPASWATSSGAHPRVGGENSSARIAPSAGGGSSPRGRGKL